MVLFWFMMRFNIEILQCCALEWHYKLPVDTILMRQAGEGDSFDWEEHSRGDNSEACWGQTETDRESDRGRRVLSGPQQTVSVYWQACPRK